MHSVEHDVRPFSSVVFVDFMVFCPLFRVSSWPWQVQWKDSERTSESTWL